MLATGQGVTCCHGQCRFRPPSREHWDSHLLLTQRDGSARITDGNAFVRAASSCVSDLKTHSVETLACLRKWCFLQLKAKSIAFCRSRSPLPRGLLLQVISYCYINASPQMRTWEACILVSNHTTYLVLCVRHAGTATIAFLLASCYACPKSILKAST